MSPLRPIASMLLIGLALLPGAGCGKKGSGLTQAQTSAFDSAPPEIKQLWDQARSAEAATNYLDAMKSLKSLRSMQLTGDQLVALDKETTDFNQRLFAAAGKNDPAAVQAVQVMRSER